MTGAEFVQRMVERWPRLPIIFMSGRPEYQHLAHGEYAYFIAKPLVPLVPADLARLIRRVTGARPLSLEAR